MKLIITKVDGGVAVMTVIGDADPIECIAKWTEVNAGQYVSHRILGESESLPPREARGAWQDVNGEISINTEAAYQSSIPQVVSMAQARKALIMGGTSIASVDAAIAGIEDDTERELAQTDWEYSATVRRDSPLVTSLGPILGLTGAQVDELFVVAGTL